jgi:hypothetical protein
MINKVTEQERLPLTINLSHIDSDGVGCSIVINKHFKHVEYLHCNYDKIEQYLSTIDDIMTRRHVENVFITDLSFNEAQMIALNNIANIHPKVKFIVLDHHPQTDDVKHNCTAANITVITDMNKCATKITYDYFNCEPKSISKLVDTINAFDIWLQDSPYFTQGMELNDLFWSYKLKRFFNVFSNDVNKDRVKADMKQLREKRIAYFDSCVKKGLINENKISLLSFCDEFPTWLQVMYPGKKVYINATTYGRVQIRLSDWITPDVADILKAEILASLPEDRVLTFGGHHRAFTLAHHGKYDSNEILEYVKIIYDIIMKFIEKESKND